MGDDMRMIKRLFRYCSLCPQCYRPYGFWKKSSGREANGDESQQRDMETDRFDRHHVLMDVVSCYFFLLLVWIPLIIICFVPAAWSKLMTNIHDSEHTSTSNATMDDGTFGDYHRGVQQQTVKNI